MKRLLPVLLLSLLPLSLCAQTITVGSTTTQLNPTQRAAVATYWPDGSMGGIYHGGTTYIFAPTTGPGTEAISLSNPNVWSSGLSVVNGTAGNIAYGGSGAFDQNYAGGGAVYDDTAVSGYYIHLYHGEQWFGGSGSPFYAALGLAYSTSLTGSWTKLGEVISPQSARVNGGTNCQAEVGVGTLVPVGSYLYAYYTDTATGCVSLGIAVARASLAAIRTAISSGLPSSGPNNLFMKYTGSGTWNGSGVTDMANIQNGGGAFTQIVTDSCACGSYIPNVRYNSVSNSYIMVYIAGSSTSAINAQTSTDGVTWGNQQTLVSGGGGFGSSSQIYYPALLNTSGTSDPNTLGANFSVFYVKAFNPPGGWSAGQTYLYSTALSIPGGGGGACGSSSPYTAASSAESDVNSCINGPGHTAVNGDTVQIPCSGTQAATWSSTLTVPANITLTALGGTPNSGASTFGAGTNCLTITAATGVLFELDPTYSATNNVVTLQNMTLVPGSGAYTPIHISGTGTSSGMPLFRVDNVQFGNGTAQWQYGTGSNTGEFDIIENNVFGVADHNTTVSGSQNAFISVNLTSYLGVGLYGDNSWAQPDSTGFANNVFIENNQLSQLLWPIVENEQTYPNIGGGRAVTRFNHITASGIFFLTGGHGNDTDGRPRSMRTNETYANTINCINGSQGNACYDFVSFRGGSGLTFGNTATLGSGAVWNEIGSLATYRIMGDGWAFSNEGSCGGAMSGNAYGPFDQNDGTTYYSGTFTSGTSGVTLVASGSPGWTTNQWSNPSPFYPYSVWDVTQGWVSIIQSNGSNTLNVSQAPHGYINGGTAINAASGDTFQITRSKSCLDGGARGQGLLLQNQPAVLASTGLVGPANEVLDPVYEWDDVVPAVQYGDQFGLSYSAPAQLNREVFTDNSLGSPHVQTSPTSPFTGASGVGFGTLANQPTTCTTNSVSGAPGVGYWATDQGSWNTSANTYGSGYSQGVLYKCTATNTWSLTYTPYTYPHPLTTGGGPPQAPAPLITPGTALYPRTQHVTISTVAGGTIYYTIDGTIPTTGSTVYTGAFNVSVTTTVQAIATVSGDTQSSVAQSVISITSGIVVEGGQQAVCEGVTNSCTLASGAVTGDAILVDASDSNGLITSVSDPTNGAYQKLNYASDPTHPGWGGQWIACNVATGTYAITLNGTGADTWINLHVKALANTLASSVCYDAAVTKINVNTAFSTSATCGTARIPTNNGEWIEGYTVPNGGTTTAGANFTLIGTIPGANPGYPEYWVQSTATATNAPQTISISTDWIDACTGVLSSSSTSTVTGVTASASPTAISTAQTSACTGVVSGTGAFNPSVTWTALNGTISSGGVYTPNSTGGPFTGTCTAASVQDPTKTGSANVTVTQQPTAVNLGGVTQLRGTIN